MLEFMNLAIKITAPNFSKCFLKLNFRNCFVMPKSRTFNFRIPKQRKKNQDEIPSYDKDGPAYLQFLGSGAHGAPKSLYFFSDQARYVFNVGEGTQRLANEHRIKISRLEHIFITNPVWENIGGLPGLALTIQECGVPKVTLHGPDGVDSLFAATGKFITLEFMKIKMANCGKDVVYSDSVVTINYVPLESNENSQVEEENDDSFDKAGLPEDTIDYYLYLKYETSSGSKKSKETYNKKTYSLSRTSMAYICRMKPTIGKLNLSACVDRDVPTGPLLGKLKAGEDITLPNGSVVRAVDVKEPDEPGAVFIIIDCPTESFLDSLQNEDAFKMYQDETEESNIPKYVIHFTPSCVMKNERYQNWMKRFPDATLHVNVNDYNKCFGSAGCHNTQYKLNILDEKIFPLLDIGGMPSVDLQTFDTAEEEIDYFLETARRHSSGEKPADVTRDQFNYPSHMGHTLRCLPLRKTTQNGSTIPDIVYLTPNEYVREITRKPSFHSEMEILKTNLQKLPVNNSLRSFPRITFLGTGSCIPNKHRNVSGILISLEKDNHMLMDCGEGTYGQIVRHFGYERSQEILAHTNIIFISHMHADHHLGLINVLNKRRKAVQEMSISAPKLIVTAPHTMLHWLNQYNSCFEKIMTNVNVISNKEFEYRSKLEYCHSEVLSVAPLKDYTTAYVTHCPYSFGISITDMNGIKVTYSGDTMPDKNLINIGKNSTLLIHEATLEDELIAEAAGKLHSTFGQAIDVGKKMQAEFTLLTHFSQRYAKIPVIDAQFDDKVGIAFDNMEVTMDDLPKLPLFNNMYKLIFDEELENMQGRQLKRRKLNTLLSDD